MNRLTKSLAFGFGIPAVFITVLWACKDLPQWGTRIAGTVSKCKRRPSERNHLPFGGEWTSCPNPIHDLADAAPEMAEALEGLLDQARTVFLSHVGEIEIVAAVKSAISTLAIARGRTRQNETKAIEE